MPLEFWFEFASTYSYPAAMRIESVARDAGRTIVWRAFLLGPIFADQGWNDSPFNLYAAKGRYMWRDLERVCDGQGIALQRPSVFPRNGLRAARVACRFAGEPWLPEFVRSVYRANFEEDRDIASEETIAACLVRAGADADAALSESTTPEAKALLRAQTEEAARLGIFGAPTFLSGDEMFWGNDRLEQAVEWNAER